MIASQIAECKFFFRRAGILCALILRFVVAPPADAAPWLVRSQPLRLVNGACALFEVMPPAPLKSLTGTWLGHEITFNFDPAAKTWFAIAGVPLETPPGIYSLQLSGAPSAASAESGAIAFTRRFAVEPARYPKVELTVPRQFTEPNPEQLAQIAADNQIKHEYMNRVTPERQWSGNFRRPAHAAISDVFGTRRVFNGETQSQHLGLDFRVPAGTPVAAMNGGTVLLARPFYFEGNCVVLDHGQGLLTVYMHLSEFKVKEGDRVKRGQILGLSGATGRVTGPHLHVAVRWQGTYLDPASLLRLPLP